LRAAGEELRLPCGLMHAADWQAAARSIVTCHYQGVSHAEWPKPKHEYSLPETIRATCRSLKAVDIEFIPSGVEKLSQRAKKL
jgi:hypothetical protein